MFLGEYFSTLQQGVLSLPWSLDGTDRLFWILFPEGRRPILRLTPVSGCEAHSHEADEEGRNILASGCLPVLHDSRIELPPEFLSTLEPSEPLALLGILQSFEIWPADLWHEKSAQLNSHFFTDLLPDLLDPF